jgi:hypothetical protein
LNLLAILLSLDVIIAAKNRLAAGNSGVLSNHRNKPAFFIHPVVIFSGFLLEMANILVK